MSTSKGAPGTLSDDGTFKQPLRVNMRENNANTSQSASESDASRSSPETGKEQRKKKMPDIVRSLTVHRGYCKTCKEHYKNCQDVNYRTQKREEIIKHLFVAHQIKTPESRTQTNTTAVKQQSTSLEFPTKTSKSAETITLEQQKQILDDRDRMEIEKIAEAENSKKRQNETEDTPTQTFKYARIFETRSFVPLSNRFNPLSEPENTDDDMDITFTGGNISDSTSTRSEIRKKVQQSIKTPRPSAQQTPQQQKPGKKDDKPPPIILKGVVKTRTGHQQFTDELNKHVTKGYKIKYAKNSTIILIDDLDEYKYYKGVLHQDSSTQWHTYATHEDKTHAFVVKGLDHLPETEEIKNELTQDHSINVKEVYFMKTNFRPLYLIVTKADYTLRKLQQIRYLNNVHISWERRNNTKRINQCRRCCMWGHGKSNCYREIRCIKCAGNHYTVHCEGNLPKKCINCGDNHQADSENCKVYLYKLSKIPAQQPQKQKYIPAPTPKYNAWTRQTQTRANGPTGSVRASDGRIPERDHNREHQGKPKTSENRVNQSENCENGDNFNDSYNSEFPSLGRMRPRNVDSAPNTSSRQAGKSVDDDFGGFMHVVGRMKNTFDMRELCRFINDFCDLKSKYPDASDRGFAIIQFLTRDVYNYGI